MNSSKLLPVWDIWIRLFHWTLAFAVLFLLYSGLTGELFFDWHRQIGELVLLLVLFRLCWGVVGSSNIRVLRLFKSPREAIFHLRGFLVRDVPPEREHNAAGSWAVIAMLLIVTTQAVTGMFIADEDEFVEGALYGAVDTQWSDWMYQVHMINANLIQLIVILHVIMIAAYLIYAKRNLLMPMITGKLKWPIDKEPPEVDFQSWWIGIICLVASGLVVGWLSNWF